MIRVLKKQIQLSTLVDNRCLHVTFEWLQRPMQENNGNKNYELKIVFFLDFNEKRNEAKERYSPLTSG